ncbi:MAG: hypothetical protein ABRQ26_15205 [Syntrophomonadaceae bacterium]
MPKEYESPKIYIQEFELEDAYCVSALFSGVGATPCVYPTNPDGTQANE